MPSSSAGAAAPAPKSFDVFLSYSRKDRDAAIRLEQALEGYRIPRHLKGVVNQLNVFRDEADIVAADDYFRAIASHIQGSAKLVVVCSPNARKSRYVADEIARFIEAHGSQHVIAALVAGKPNNETPDEDEWAFPEILCAENRMPLAASFVGCERHKGRLHEGPYRSAFFSTLAAINGVERRRLEEIDEKAARRRRVLTLSAAAAIIATLSVALVLAIIARGEAEGARRVAEQERAQAVEARDAAQAARQALQRQYLEAIGEMSVGEVLGADAAPGEVRADASAGWTPVLQTNGLVFAAWREYGDGRMLALAHDGVLTGKSQRFMRQLFEWLRGPTGPKRIAVSSSHCEWVTLGNIPLPDRLATQGYSTTDLPGVIDDRGLDGAGILVLGNAWGNLDAGEMAAIDRFVTRGGGLVAAGLGWSWQTYAATPGYACEGRRAGQDVGDLATYPMNRLLASYGASWTARASDTAQ